MTAIQFASLVHGRKVGKNRWTAKCPSHPDRHPSLSIATGRKGILIRCMSNGCDTRTILDALGLTWNDLFSDTCPDRDHLRRLKELEEQQEHERKEKRRLAGLALEQAYVWDTVSSELGRLLANYPDDPRLADLFHHALDMCRRCERIAMAYHTPKTWGIGIVAGCGYAWPVKVTREQVGEEIGNRLGL